MQFFQSFHSLGYSAINLVIVFSIAVAILYRVLGLQKRGLHLKLLYLLVMLVPFVFATNFLADQNRILNDSIREEGGLKRTNKR